MSGEPLKVKDLIPVNFTPLNKEVSKTSKGRYMCPVTHDVLSNSTTCAVLKPRYCNIYTQECLVYFV